MKDKAADHHLAKRDASKDSCHGSHARKSDIFYDEQGLVGKRIHADRLHGPDLLFLALDGRAETETDGHENDQDHGNTHDQHENTNDHGDRRFVSCRAGFP